MTGYRQLQAIMGEHLTFTDNSSQMLKYVQLLNIGVL